jgi:hypothetical protein
MLIIKRSTERYNGKVVLCLCLIKIHVMNTHVGVATNAYPRHEMVLVICLKADQLQPTRGVTQFGRTHPWAALVYTRIEGRGRIEL